MIPIIHPNELIELQKKSNLIIIDCSSGAGVKESYAAQHLEGALHIDLDTDLAEVPADASKGGRHPLPIVSKFCDVLTKLGITPDSHVIAYDDKNGANAAARFWWMLKALGHKKVQVINGGLQGAIKAGFPVSSKVETPSATMTYQASQWLLPQADITNVDIARLEKNSLVIDVRDKERFDGIKEPIDTIAGHIPGAINVPFVENLDKDGFYLSPETLKEKYVSIIDYRKIEEVIVHCGSGVTACHTLLAMDYAGLEIPKLYVGSWSEWSRNNRPMFTKNM